MDGCTYVIIQFAVVLKNDIKFKPSLIITKIIEIGVLVMSKKVADNCNIFIPIASFNNIINIADIHNIIK